MIKRRNVTTTTVFNVPQLLTAPHQHFAIPQTINATQNALRIQIAPKQREVSALKQQQLVFNATRILIALINSSQNALLSNFAFNAQQTLTALPYLKIDPHAKAMSVLPNAKLILTVHLILTAPILAIYLLADAKPALV